MDARLKAALLLVAIALTGVADAATLPSCFLGRWRSAEAMTLADMRNHPEVTDGPRKLFENRFFGRLVIVNGPSRGASFMEPDGDRSTMVFDTFDIVSATDTSAFLRAGSQNEKWFCEGGHLFVLVTRWKFREYFSPA